jgi:tRNA (guanine37-N1)-methyltransferase
MRLVKPGETVIVMFAGVGPFAIEIARAQKTSRVIAMELNRVAVAAMKKNIALNRATNVLPVLGDAKRNAAKYAGKADRVVMPLPKEGKNFLDAALKAAKANATIHFYFFGSTTTAFLNAQRLIRESAKRNGCKSRTVFKRIVRPYSHNEVEVVLDCRITRPRAAPARRS